MIHNITHMIMKVIRTFVALVWIVIGVRYALATFGIVPMPMIPLYASSIVFIFAAIHMAERGWCE